MQALSVKNSVSNLLPIVKKSATARSIAVYLGERARHRTNTDLKRLKYDMYQSGFFLDDNEYDAFWEDLAKASAVGRLIRATVIEEPEMADGKPVIVDGKPVVHKHYKSAKFHWNFSCHAFGIELLAAMKAAGIDPHNADMSLARLENGGNKPAKIEAPKVEEPKAEKKPSKAMATVRIQAGNAKLFIPMGLTKAEAEAISKELFALAK